MNYQHAADKATGDGITLGDWNNISNAVAGNGSLTLAVGKNDKVGVGTNNPTEKLDIEGSIRIGGGTPINRIIAGRVSGDGSLIAGSGFSCSHTGTGQYVIKFDIAFKDTPVITVTSNDADDDNVATVSARGGEANIYIYDIFTVL